VCCLHVLGCLGNRNVEVQVEAEDRSGDQNEEDRKGGVLIIGNLDLHGTKLDTPANVVAWWWRLETHVLPVGGLQILEMIDFVKVKLLEVFSEDNNGIADEEMCEVGSKEIVHATIHKFLLCGFIYYQLGVKVLPP